jgi:hypothetical protein
MPAYNKFFDFTEQQLIGTHDWDANVFRIMLTDTTPLQTYTIKSQLTEIAAVNGYPGTNTTTITLSESGGVTTVQGTQITFLASGGNIGPFRYAVLYNDSAPNKNLIAWWDNGSSLTLNNGDSFVIRFSTTSPGTIFTLT